jgi:hypothetical protein
VTDGMDSWHLPVGSTWGLAALLRTLSAERAAIGRMSGAIHKLAAPAPVAA